MLFREDHFFGWGPTVNGESNARRSTVTMSISLIIPISDPTLTWLLLHRGIGPARNLGAGACTRL
jgi:hypothetical protein